MFVLTDDLSTDLVRYMPYVLDIERGGLTFTTAALRAPARGCPACMTSCERSSAATGRDVRESDARDDVDRPSTTQRKRPT